MKLWLLTLDSWVSGFVVRAETETQARELAQRGAIDKGVDADDSSVWISKASCIELHAAGTPGIILCDADDDRA